MPQIKVFTRRVSVNYDLQWQAAITRAAPQTPKDDGVFRAGRRYAAGKHGVAAGKVRIIYFGCAMTSRKALAYGKARGLKPAHPRVVLAIAEQHPQLLKEFGRTCIDLVALQSCASKIRRMLVLAYESGGARVARLGRFDWPWDEGFGFVFEE